MTAEKLFSPVARLCEVVSCGDEDSPEELWDRPSSIPPNDRMGDMELQGKGFGGESSVTPPELFLHGEKIDVLYRCGQGEIWRLHTSVRAWARPSIAAPMAHISTASSDPNHAPSPHPTSPHARARLPHSHHKVSEMVPVNHELTVFASDVKAKSSNGTKCTVEATIDGKPVGGGYACCAVPYAMPMPRHAYTTPSRSCLRMHVLPLVPLAP